MVGLTNRKHKTAVVHRLICDHKMSIPNFTKRRRLDGIPTANSATAPGFALGTNGNVLNPADPNQVVGSNNNPKSGGTNDHVHVKIIAVPTPFPKGNRWVDTTPLGAVCFVHNFASMTNRANYFLTDTPRTKGVFRDIDRMHMLTPERLNYLLHRDALNNRLKNANRPLYEIFREWRVAGIMGSPAVADHQSRGNRNERLSDERAVDLRPCTDGHVINYWGENVAGDVNYYLFFVLIEQDISDETTYITDVERNGSGTAGSVVDDPNLMSENIADSAEINGVPLASINLEQHLRVPWVPRWVARYSETNYLSEDELKYVVTDSDGNEHERYGHAIKIGRCKVNQVFDQKIAMTMQAHGQMCDMNKAWMLPKLNVQVEIEEVHCI